MDAVKHGLSVAYACAACQSRAEYARRLKRVSALKIARGEGRGFCFCRNLTRSHPASTIALSVKVAAGNESDSHVEKWWQLRGCGDAGIDSIHPNVWRSNTILNLDLMVPMATRSS